MTGRAHPSQVPGMRPALVSLSPSCGRGTMTMAASMQAKPTSSWERALGVVVQSISQPQTTVSLAKIPMNVEGIPSQVRGM